MARETVVLYVVFSNGREVGLNWSLEVSFVKYTSFCQLHPYSKVQVQSTRIEMESALEKKRLHVNMTFS